MINNSTPDYQRPATGTIS